MTFFFYSSSSYFSQIIDFNVPQYKPYESVCIKRQSLFSGKSKKNILNVVNWEFLSSMLSVRLSVKTCGPSPMIIWTNRECKPFAVPSGPVVRTYTTWAAPEEKSPLEHMQNAQIQNMLCMSPMEKICMKCQILFSGKSKKMFQFVVCSKMYWAYLVLTPHYPFP